MKIEKLLTVEGCSSKWPVAAWRVVFEADGKLFSLDQIMQLNKPEIHHIQYEADIHPEYFWKYWAKSAAGYAICSALDNSPISTLFGFETEQEAKDKLKDLTERGVIKGIPVRIIKFD